MDYLQPKVNGNAKLSEAEVRHIRYLLDTKQSTPRLIAEMHRISTETVRRIGRREIWQWVPEAPRKTEEEWKEAAAESFARLQERLAAPVGKEPLPAEQRKSATDKMLQLTQQVKEKQGQGDKLLNELKGEESGK